MDETMRRGHVGKVVCESWCVRLAWVPGRSVEKMDPKSVFTLACVSWSASIFFCPSSLMTASILALSFSTVSRLPILTLTLNPNPNPNLNPQSRPPKT